MRYRVVFHIFPAGPFGLPQEGHTVVPPGHYVGNAYHTQSQALMEHGSQSRFRADSERLAVEVSLPNAMVSFRDNIATVTVDAPDPGTAISTASSTLDRYLMHLSVNQKQPFTFQAQAVLLPDESGSKVLQGFVALRMTCYDLPKLSADARDAARYVSLDDERLRRATMYFEHALLLLHKRDRVTDSFSRHFRYLLSAVFLNLWKSVTAILGDPAEPKDGYQKRYRHIGFDRAFKTKLDRLKALRDDYDVAHSTLDDSRLAEVEKASDEALGIASSVIQRYREYRLRGGV